MQKIKRFFLFLILVFTAGDLFLTAGIIICTYKVVADARKEWVKKDIIGADIRTAERIRSNKTEELIILSYNYEVDGIFYTFTKEHVVPPDRFAQEEAEKMIGHTNGIAIYYDKAHPDDAIESVNGNMSAAQTGMVLFILLALGFMVYRVARKSWTEVYQSA